MVICTNPRHKQRKGEEHWHESQASTFHEKRLEVGLTYIFGVGRSTALQICTATGLARREGSGPPDPEMKAARVHRRSSRSKVTCGGAPAVDQAAQEIGAYRGMRHRRSLR